jgi:hypothetical protein
MAPEGGFPLRTEYSKNIIIVTERKRKDLNATLIQP